MEKITDVLNVINNEDFEEDRPNRTDYKSSKS